MLTVPIAWISLGDAIVCLVLGTIVLMREPRNRMNQVFMLLCLSIAYWAFMEFEIRQSATLEQADFWSRYNFLWPVSVALVVHFVLIFTKHRRRRETIAAHSILYGLAATISVLYLTSPQMRATPVKQSWGWTYGLPDTLVYRLSILTVVGMATFALVLTFLFYLKQTDLAKKKETRLVLAGIALPIILASVTDAILPQLGIRFPEVTATSFAVGVAGFIGYAIWKYEMFGMTPTQAADKIVTAISDCLFLVDPEGNILNANRAALDLLGYREDELTGQPMDKVFHHRRELERNQDPTGEVSLGICDLETTLLTKDGCQVPVSLSDSPMRDSHGRKLGSVLIARDITERKVAEKALRESESRLRVIMESIQAGIVIIDPDAHTIVDVNKIAASTIGEPKEKIVGSVCHKFICPAEAGKCPITDLHQTVDNSERVLLTSSGTSHPILKSVTPVMLGGKEHLLESFIDISALKLMEQQLKASLVEKEKLANNLYELATHDNLTGLYNHRAFYQLLDDEMERARRFNRPVSLLMIDIDHFKQVNDKHGHLAGDAVLNELSGLLRRCVRAIDRVCRYGGEEITLILPESDRSRAAETAERLRSAVEKHRFDGFTDSPLRITVSIGAASLPEDAGSIQALVSSADAAMFAAKRKGRNRVCLYEAEPGQPEIAVANDGSATT